MNTTIIKISIAWLNYLPGATHGADDAGRNIDVVDELRAPLGVLCDIVADASYAQSDAIMVAVVLVCCKHTYGTIDCVLAQCEASASRGAGFKHVSQPQQL